MKEDFLYWRKPLNFTIQSDRIQASILSRCKDEEIVEFGTTLFTVQSCAEFPQSTSTYFKGFVLNLHRIALSPSQLLGKTMLLIYFQFLEAILHMYIITRLFIKYEVFIKSACSYYADRLFCICLWCLLLLLLI